MTITREQVADLQPGDVVRIKGYSVDVHTIDGTVTTDTSGGLWLGEWLPLSGPESPAWTMSQQVSLEILRRAPRRLYVNHPRTRSVSGDVVRDADDENDTLSWNCCHGTWYDPGGISCARGDMPDRLRLLVDGETGQVVR